MGHVPGIALIVLALVVSPGMALAGGKSSRGGPLSQTSSGISSRSNASSSKSSSSSSSSSSSYDEADEPTFDDDDDDETTAGDGHRRFVAATSAIFHTKPEFDLYGGVMGVRGSGAALDVSLAVRSGYLRLLGANSSFFEEQGDGSTLNVNMYRVGVGLALVGEQTRLHLDAGVGGVVTDAESVLGVFGQAEVRHRLGHQVWADVVGRWFELEHDIRAIDVGVGVRLSIVRVGYRHLDFNVGPPLRGPELGLALTF